MIERAQARSAVFDMVSHGVPIAVEASCHELALRGRTGGRRALVALAEALADDFATRAAEHDRSASYPSRASTRCASPATSGRRSPCSTAGSGVGSVHDLLVAASRLARGDASVAIGVNMHTAVLRNIVRRWEMATAASNERRAAGLPRHGGRSPAAAR